MPEPRLARYRQAAGPDPEILTAFYRGCARLSLALFADIAALEVAMRSAIARELVREYGLEWYARRDIFDDDASRALSAAWTQGGLQRLRDDRNVAPEVVEGKLVAALMFGFWVKLLGRGSWAGRAPLRERRVYDTLLWRPALINAFPLAPGRRDAEQAATVVRAARNRIAHHEHIAWGVPLPGQRRRLSVKQVHEALLLLAEFISTETRAWIEATSEAPALLEGCPVDTSALRLR